MPDALHAQRWRRLKAWLANVTTNGPVATEHVEAMREVVLLIEMDTEPEPDGE